MKFPKLKNPILCKLVFLIGPLVAMAGISVAIICLAPVEELIKALIIVAMVVLYIVFLFANFGRILQMEMLLDLYRYHTKARKWFALPQDFDANVIEAKISLFGQACEPAKDHVELDMLQYKSWGSATVFYSSHERIVLTYCVDNLDEKTFRQIANSAKANSNALKGTKKHTVTDSRQLHAPMMRVTVPIIFAQRVDSAFKDKLLDAICTQVGDGSDDATLICVVNMDDRTCTFDSMQEFYMQTRPAKNRGIKIIKKLLFGNKFTYQNSPEMLPNAMDMDPEQSIWEFWRGLKKRDADWDKETRARFANMASGETLFEEDCLFVKLGENGLLALTEMGDNNVVHILPFTHWDYPKNTKIDENAMEQLRSMIDAHFQNMGLKTEYISDDE